MSVLVKRFSISVSVYLHISLAPVHMCLGKKKLAQPSVMRLAIADFRFSRFSFRSVHMWSGICFHRFGNLALVPVQASGSVDGFVCAYDVCILIFLPLPLPLHRGLYFIFSRWCSNTHGRAIIFNLFMLMVSIVGLMRNKAHMHKYTYSHDVSDPEENKVRQTTHRPKNRSASPDRRKNRWREQSGKKIKFQKNEQPQNLNTDTRARAHEVCMLTGA